MKNIINLLNIIIRKKKYIYIYKMNNNEMIMLIIAFVVGFMIRELMKIMCRSRLVEGMCTCDDGHKEPLDDNGGCSFCY